MKSAAKELFAKFGVDMTTAINMFLRQAVRTQSIPADLRLKPNQETIAAMEEAKRLANDSNVKRYTSAEEAFEDIKLKF